jgi:hypothetical protein
MTIKASKPNDCENRIVCGCDEICGKDEQRRLCDDWNKRPNWCPKIITNLRAKE